MFQRGDDAGIGEGCGITQNPAFSDIAQQPAHDFGAARLGQLGGEENIVGPGDGADLLGHVLAEFLLKRVTGMRAILQGDEGGDSLPFNLVRFADHRGFGHRRDDPPAHSRLRKWKCDGQPRSSRRPLGPAARSIRPRPPWRRRQ